jgi:hypothetical protein
MKRNFRYITKFEEQTRSARPERRDNAYKSVVNSYFENIGIYYENDEVNIIDDRNATTKVEQTIGGWQEGWNSKKFVVPIGLPCRPARNVALSNSGDGQKGWWLDNSSPKVKAFIKKVIAMQVEHPEFENNSSSTELETREAKRDWRKYIEFTKIDGNDPAQAEEDGTPYARGYYFYYIGNDTLFGAYKSLAQAKIEAKKDFEESFDEGGIYNNSSSARLETRARAGELDEVGARELYLFTDNESKLQNQQKSIITNLARKFAKGLYDKDLAIKLWTYLADSASKLYSNDNGAQFTPATRRETARMLEELHFSSVQDEAIDYKKRSTSAQLETRMSNLLAVWLPTNQAYFFFEGDEKKSPSTWTKVFVNQSTKGVLSTKQDLEEWAKSEGKDLTKIRKGLYVVDPDYNTNSTSTRLEKRGWFGGDDEDEEEEKQPASQRDLYNSIREMISNKDDLYEQVQYAIDEIVNENKNKSKPKQRNFDWLIKEVIEDAITQYNSSIDDDSDEAPSVGLSSTYNGQFFNDIISDDLDAKWREVTGDES